MTPALFSQEVDARILLDTINVLTNPINRHKEEKIKRDIIVTYFTNLDRLLAQMFTVKILHEKKLPYKRVYFEIT
jgi:ribosomal protein S15P/S13E